VLLLEPEILGNAKLNTKNFGKYYHPSMGLFDIFKPIFKILKAYFLYKLQVIESLLLLHLASQQQLLFQNF
jgi:hypothetical protein